MIDLKGLEIEVTKADEEPEQEEEYFCPECGAKITLDMTHCPKCGVEFECEVEENKKINISILSEKIKENRDEFYGRPDSGDEQS